MKTIKFWKMSGSGNDFVVIDNRRRALRGSLSRWAKRLCHRRFGAGADGMLLLELPLRRSRRYGGAAVTAGSAATAESAVTAEPEAFRMVYYNADGSRAEMCGNGARCMAWFAHAQGVVGKAFCFTTDAYPVGAKVSGRTVQVSLAEARDYRPRVTVKTGGKTYRPAFINTGVPQAVLFVPDAKKASVSVLGRALRFHKAFGPKGTNVNFVQKLSAHKLRVRTYERGVEGETLACGTGVTASAIAAVLGGRAQRPVQCVVSGGDTLEVNFNVHPGNRTRPVSAVSLTGPVRLTYKGEFHV